MNNDISGLQELTNPILVSSSPTDGSTNQFWTDDIVLTFNENVNIQNDSTLTIHPITGGVFETITLKDSDGNLSSGSDGSTNVTGDGTNVITIDPNDDFNDGIGYYINISAGAFADIDGNLYAGISDKVTLEFWATSSDTTNPTITSHSFSNGDLILNFTEPVNRTHASQIVIRDTATGHSQVSHQLNSAAVTGLGTNKITVSLGELGTIPGDYYAELDSGAFEDLSGNSHAGVFDSSTLGFTVLENTPPTLASTSFSEAGIVLNFSENVVANAGTNLYIHNDDGSGIVASSDVTDASVSGDGTNQITCAT